MTAALILVAGIVPDGSKRRPTDDIGGASSIKRLIMVFRHAGIRKIVVVTGSDAETIERHCAHMGVVFLRNDGYEAGDMLSSVKIGLDYLRDKCEKAFISPTDVPLFSSETVRSIQDMPEPAVIPICNNKTGHPILVSRSLFNRVLGYCGPGGLEGALSGSEVERRFLDVPDEGILVDTMSSADISSIAEKQGLRNIRPDAKIQLSGEKGFFGPGASLLLGLTQETGSLKQAAKQMGVSYSKAIKMIAVIEEQLGYQILESQRGGSGGGSSLITKEGLDFMRRYEAFESECKELIKCIYEKHFG